MGWNRSKSGLFRDDKFNMKTIPNKVIISFSLLDPGGQDTFDFAPRSDSVELTARAVSGVYLLTSGSSTY